MILSAITSNEMFLAPGHLGSCYVAVRPRNPTREDPTRAGSWHSPGHVRETGRGRSSDRPAHVRQGPHPEAQRHVHPRHGLLRHRLQHGHQEAAPRCREYT